MSGDAGTKGLEDRFVEKVDRFVIWLEKDHLPLIGVFLMVLIVSFTRDMLEYFLLDPQFVNTVHPWIYSIAHHMAFYSVVFLGLVFLLSAFSGRGVRRSINYVSTFFWIIILPPILDYLAGFRQNYAYMSWADFMNALFHFSGAAFHIGQAIEVVVVLFALFAYGIWIQRDKLFSIKDRAVTVVQIGSLVVFTFVSLFIVATPEAYLPVSPQSFPQFDTVKYYQWHLFLFSYYLAAGVALALAITYLATKPRFREVLQSMRPAQTLFFGGIVAAGIAIGWETSGSADLVTQILTSPYWVNLAFAGISIIAALLAWETSTMWNDLSDRFSDEPKRRGRLVAAGVVSPRVVSQISAILAIVAVACSAILSPFMLLLMLIILLLSYVYSFKPVRFKNHVLSPMLIGAGAFMAFIFGYSTPYSVVAFATSPEVSIPYLTGAVESASLTANALFIGFFMFLGLVIGSMVTDIDGFQEDSRAGVKTVYTILGLERGKLVVSVLTVIVGLTPMFLFHLPLDILIFSVLAVAAGLMLFLKGASRPVLIIAMVGLLYAAIRFLGLMSWS